MVVLYDHLLLCKDNNEVIQLMAIVNPMIMSLSKLDQVIAYRESNMML